jgi:hypothetical protein
VDFSEAIGSLATCYRLVAFDANGPIGGTQVLCTDPGASSFVGASVLPRGPRTTSSG